jgi:hypothetical protein
VVAFVVDDGEGAVELLQQYHSCQLVGKGQGRQRQLVLTGGQDFVGQAQRAADDESQTAVTFDLLSQKTDKLVTKRVLAWGCQDDATVGRFSRLQRVFAVLLPG